MKPEEALYHLVNYGPAYVPAFYRHMERAQLEALVRECDKPTAEQRSEAALTRWAQQRLKMPAWVGMNEPPKETPETETTALPAADPVPEEPRTLADRAILKPERLRTPRRRQSAFLSHFARCRTVIEAAARAGVDRRTVHRWRQNDPLFDKKCRDIIEARRRQAVENVVLAADHVEIRPVFYRGRKIAEYARRDRALDLYLLKQADARAEREEQQAEKRRDAAATAAAKADFEARVAAEVEKRVAAGIHKAIETAAAQRHSEMSPSRGQQAAVEDDEFTNVFNDIEPATCDMARAR